MTYDLLQAEIIGGTIAVLLGIWLLWLWLRHRDRVIRTKLDEHHLATHAKLDAVIEQEVIEQRTADIQHLDERVETGYLRAAVEGMRAALHASDEAAALRGDKSKDALKGFQLSIWRQFTERLRASFNKNHTNDPPNGGSK
jgi:ABC-type nickel/cobalt efflux system permease component RcnA